MYIGDNKIKECKTLEEKTPGNNEILEIEYMNGKKESLSKLMYENIVSEKSCDATALRDKRVHPVVASMLSVLREWGLKTNEFPYLSALLNQSMKSNEEEALKELWKRWIPTINSIDDVDLISVDRVLKSKKDTPSPYGNKV